MTVSFLFLLVLLSFLPSSSHGADPPGHMQPLGSHRDPELVTKLSHIPSPLEFREDYILPSRPVVLEGILSRTELLSNWQQDSYLKTHFGEEEMNVEYGKKENRSGQAISLTVSEFLDRYGQEDIYMVSTMPDSMRKEWLLPRFILCGGYTKNLMYTFLWFSSGGTKSVLHTDTYENLHCLVSGQKEFVLFDPKYSKVIGPEHEELGFYHIDVDRVDMTTYPGLIDVPWHLATVNAGDCLYLPYSWLHHVRSYGRNFGVNVWWIPFEFQAEECTEDVPDFAPLGNFQITPELQLKLVMREHAREDGTVHAEDLHKMMSQNNRLAGVTLDNVNKLFDLLKPGCNGILHSPGLDSIPLERYKTSFEYILEVQEEMIMNRSEQEADFQYFSDEGEFGGYGEYDFEDPEHPEGGGDFDTPTWHRKDEL